MADGNNGAIASHPHEHSSKSPDVADLAAGERLRYLRKQRRMSQGALAQKMGVSFQQIQKYERAANRMSVSTLGRAAAALEVPVTMFFDEELPQGLAELLPDLSAPGTIEIAQRYGKMVGAQREIIMLLAREFTRHLDYKK